MSIENKRSCWVCIQVFFILIETAQEAFFVFGELGTAKTEEAYFLEMSIKGIIIGAFSALFFSLSEGKIVGQRADYFRGSAPARIDEEAGLSCAQSTAIKLHLIREAIGQAQAPLSLIKLSDLEINKWGLYLSLGVYAFLVSWQEYLDAREAAAPQANDSCCKGLFLWAEVIGNIIKVLVRASFFVGSLVTDLAKGEDDFAGISKTGWMVGIVLGAFCAAAETWVHYLQSKEITDKNKSDAAPGSAAKKIPTHQWPGLWLHYASDIMEHAQVPLFYIKLAGCNLADLAWWATAGVYVGLGGYGFFPSRQDHENAKSAVQRNNMRVVEPHRQLLLNP